MGYTTKSTPYSFYCMWYTYVCASIRFLINNHSIHGYLTIMLKCPSFIIWDERQKAGSIYACVNPDTYDALFLRALLPSYLSCVWRVNNAVNHKRKNHLQGYVTCLDIRLVVVVPNILIQPATCGCFRLERCLHLTSTRFYALIRSHMKRRMTPSQKQRTKSIMWYRVEPLASSQEPNAQST